MYFLYTFLSILVLIVLLLPGFFLRKLKLLSDGASKDLSSILVYVGTPSMIFYCMMTVDISLILPERVVLCFIIAVLIHVVGYVIARIIFRNNSDVAKKAAATFSSVFSNCGFLGIPVANVAISYCESFTDSTVAIGEATFYMTIFNVVFNLLNWTLGSLIYGGKERKSVVLRKAILNPCSIATLIALPFTLCGISFLKPLQIGDFEVTQIASVITYLYNICVPLSMCILGVRLADVNFVDMIKDVNVFLSMLIKLVAVPAITVGVMLLLNLAFDLGAPFILAMTVMSATPSATTALAFAERYGGNGVLASECIVLSTVVSVLTLPLFLLFVTSVIFI